MPATGRSLDSLNVSCHNVWWAGEASALSGEKRKVEELQLVKGREPSEQQDHSGQKSSGGDGDTSVGQQPSGQSEEGRTSSLQRK